MRFSKSLAFALLSAALLVVLAAAMFEGVFAYQDSVSAVSDIPSNLQKVTDYNTQQAEFYFKNLSFIIAFIAGILAMLTPCSLAILPAFFAYSFRTKKEITKMTLAFFSGFAPVFIVLGLLAGFLGKTIAVFQQDNQILVRIAGLLIIIFGFMALFGRGFSFFNDVRIFQNSNAKKSKGILSVFLFGVLFATGFTVCMSPIIAGILLIAGVLQNYLYASILMLFYSLGLFVPLFVISLSFDRWNFPEKLRKINKKIGFPLANLVSGALMILIGSVFLVYGGSFIVEYIAIGELTAWVYSVQKKIVSSKIINIIGSLLIIWISYLLIKAVKNR